MKEASPRHRRDSGFSMIEVLVAVALLAVILLALFSLVSMGVQRAYSGKKMTQASMIAQAAMERANVYEAHTLLGAASTATSISQTWTRTSTATTPAAVTLSTPPTTEQIERNNWRSLLESADLQAYDDRPATLTVTMTAVPVADAIAIPPVVGRTFANAAMVRIQVDLVWFEWGTRRRQVRLQSLNLRRIP